jgi:hypothetical protein
MSFNSPSFKWRCDISRRFTHAVHLVNQWPKAVAEIPFIGEQNKCGTTKENFFLNREEFTSFTPFSPVSNAILNY